MFAYITNKKNISILKLASTIVLISFLHLGQQVPRALADTIALDCQLFFDPNVMNYFKSWELILPKLNEVKYISLLTKNKTYMTIIDLAHTSLYPGTPIANTVQSYFDYVRQVYSERLKKYAPEGFTEQSSRQVDAAIQLETSLQERSFIIVDTPSEIKLGALDFNGGIRVTMARNENEKLPLQYEFPDFRRYDNSGTSIEVGRLTSHSAISSSIALVLIKTALQVALQYPNVHDFYVHTSKTHARLYKLMGLEPTNIDIKDDLNYILRFTMRDAINWMGYGQTRRTAH